MKRVLEYLLIIFLRIILWFRYRLVFKGLDKLTPETIHKPGGVLFLPSHPAVFVDPIAVTLGAWKKYPIRPMVVEYMYYTPFIHSVMRFINAVPVPNFTTSSNSLKRKKTEAVMRTVVEGLKAKENFLIYPAGKVKLSHREVIGGASGVHQIIQEVPDVNIVLVRVKGLWGSSFSSYFGDKSLSLGEAIVQGIKICLKNLLFFTPRREVIVEFEPAPADFPYHGSRMDLNRYLEDWYNRPDGLTQQTGESPGDSLVLVSYSMWGEKYLEASKEKKLEDQSFKLEAIPEATKQKVVKKIAELAEVDPAKVALESNLAFDLGLDSLDIAELTAFLADEFDVKGIPVNQLTTVGHTLGIASRQIVCKEEVEEEEANISHWKQPVKRVQLEIAPGDTIAEVFLNNSAKMGKQIACGDTRSGILTYSQLRIRVLLLAEHIRHLPGQYIGVLLPASVAANVVILAIEVAGKIPLMINWTVGPRHLESVVKLSNVQAVLSSWAFLDKLENVELNGIEEKLVMLEDMRREFSLWKKFKAMMLSKFSTRSILKAFDIDKKEKSDPAVLLFTSGTENLPKGVPLSHNNLLSHLRAVLEVVDVYSDDVFFGILPPFHSFGFSVSCLLSVLSGLKVASSPDPTDGRRLALGVEKWGVTIVCGAPIF
ncbi:MAG: AMP-binding protein, partial [Parachlamydiaceae bacterium]